MLRPDLPPLDAYLADASLLSEEEFLDRHADPWLVVDQADPAVLELVDMRETRRPGTRPPGILDLFDDATSRGAALDAVCLRLRPRDDFSYDRITLGRAVRSDIVLLHETISSLHAEVSWSPQTFRAVLTDLDSRNGTFVNGKRLPRRGHCVLATGCVVAFGALGARFYTPSGFLSWLTTGASRSGAAPHVR